MYCMTKKTTQNLTLKVAEAQGRDVGRGIGRIDPNQLKELGLEVGDIAEISGKKKAVIKLMPTFPEDRGKEIIHVCFHGVKLFHGDPHRLRAPLGLIVILHHPLLGLYGDVVHTAFEAAFLHHNDRAFVAADQARNVLGIGHARSQHQRVAMF